ncbi:uncharacterized protein [Rutidosis leptorrhynchoides]|uniref:uncharacterized protein n=1 Tax=Rutidosis leptorrhynchoides TaxID=125765 RepID=UPI003A99D15B
MAYQVSAVRPSHAVAWGVDIISSPRATTDYDVIVEPRGEVPKRLNKLHPRYMSSQFPLMFVYGEPGFHLGLMLQDVPGSPAGREIKMTMNMYYSYQIHDRLGVYSLMLRMGRLFQKYVVTVYCSIELNRMDYIRHKQNDIRNEYLSGLYDAIDRGTKPVQMLVAGQYSLLHLPIARYLQPYTLLTPSDRADVVARVFLLRVGEFVAFLKEEQPFGVFRGVLYTIEFQKRGLQHCHTLLWVHSPPLSLINQHIDDYISAELPDPRTDPVGYAVICATMMHGPCGLAKPSAPCMELSACSKKFPKLYNSKTYFDADGCAHYRRRNTGIYTTRGGVKLDNSYVVPYNLLLCLTFHTHINVEFCGWTMLIKYLFKYISKGTDRVADRITRPVGNTDGQQSQVPKPIDEIQNFIDARFICLHEACWCIFNFPIHHREPAVQILGVHLENMQLLTFHACEPLEFIVQTNPMKKTTLTQWLHYNASFSAGHHLTYLDFPLEFVWYDGNKCWKQRANLKKPCIRRLTYIHPAFEEAFFLRMLLCHQKGCKSFADIRTVNNIVHSTYRSACEAIGLFGDDKEWSTALEEASVSASSSELRSLFANILMYCSVTNPLNLWEKH